MKKAGPKILVVDDEQAIRRYLRLSLSAHGYGVAEAGSGREALLAAESIQPELIILDLGLPDMDGIEVLHRLRGQTATPVLILSIRENEQDKVAALDAGADDYLSKPFGNEELLARIRGALRRSTHARLSSQFQVGELKVDLVSRQVVIGSKEVALTHTEYDLLWTLVQNAGKVLTHRQILHAVWGGEHEQESHLLRVTLSNLRRKIEPDPSQPRYILTEPGVGYRLRANSNGS